jgi:hypothetical protein
MPVLGESSRCIEQVTGVDWDTRGLYAYPSNASN